MGEVDEKALAAIDCREQEGWVVNREGEDEDAKKETNVVDAEVERVTAMYTGTRMLEVEVDAACSAGELEVSRVAKQRNTQTKRQLKSRDGRANAQLETRD